MYSDQKSLSTHVSDHHEKTEQKCPICPNKVYTSEGIYYNHMRTAHQVGRKGQKLKEVLQNNEEKESSEEENNGDISDGSDEDESKKKRSGTTSKGDDDQQEDENDLKKKKKAQANQAKGKQSKPASKNSASGSKNNNASKAIPKKTKPDNSQPSKLTYHCPFSTCKHLEYEEEQEYFNHLFTFHKLQGKK